MRTVVFAGVVSCMVATGLAAQAQNSDRLGSWLDWGTVKVGLYPTAQFGMQLTVSTDVEALFRPMHGMSGGFDPDSVLDWLNYADRVVHPSAPPTSPDAALLTPVLRSWSGDSIRFLRRAKGRKWDPHMAVMVDIPGPHPDRFDLLVVPSQAVDLMAALQREAMVSGFNADSALAVRTRAVPEEADQPPVLIDRGPMSAMSVSGLRGRVVLRFIVDTNGHADPASVETLMADHMALAQQATAAVLGERFTPGKLQGRPVAVMVMQRINFSP